MMKLAPILLQPLWKLWVFPRKINNAISFCDKIGVFIYIFHGISIQKFSLDIIKL
jgi:hypothetical protein